MDGSKCELDQCSCEVTLGEEFCSDNCRRNETTEEDREPHSRCGCKHTDCVSAQ